MFKLMSKKIIAILRLKLCLTSPMGTYHIHTNVYFNPCISASQVIGHEGQGVYVLMSGLDIERGVVASMPVG